MRQPVIIRVYKDSRVVEVKQFHQDQIVIGSESEVNLVLNDSKVSPIHCLIEMRDSGYYICDLGSEVGTMKNGNAILDEPLSSGDEVTVGVFKLQFMIGLPKTQAPQSVSQPAAVSNAKKPLELVPNSSVGKSNLSDDTTPVPTMTPPEIPSISPLQGLDATHLLKKESTVILKAPTVEVEVAQDTVSKKFNKPGMKPTKTRDSLGRTTKVTYAPESEIRDLGRYLTTTRGNAIEVIVAWKERVLESYHITEGTAATIGSDDKAVIKIPSALIRGSTPFIELKLGCRVVAYPSFKVTLKNVKETMGLEQINKAGKGTPHPTGTIIRLDQSEVLCLDWEKENLQIFVRWSQAIAPPATVGFFDFSLSQVTGAIVGMTMMGLFAFYISVYQAPPVEEKKEDEKPRYAQFVYQKQEPPPPEPPPPEPPPPEPPKPEPPKPVPPKKVVVDMEKQASKPVAKKASEKPAPAKAVEVAKNDNKDVPKKFTSVKQGGAVKLGPVEGAAAKAPSKDVTKMGLLSAFGAGGVRSQVDQGSNGAGDLMGAAALATGAAGQNANRAGDDIGSQFKATGAGGKGTATEGIADVGTKGRGSGQGTYGSGVGNGTGKGNVTVNSGGGEEGFEGSIDREAVRRTIRGILSKIKNCYERQLRTQKELEGKVVIQFEIGAKGVVGATRTKSSTLGSPAVEGCVADRIKEAQFPEPPAGQVAVVDYPFLFGAQK